MENISLKNLISWEVPKSDGLPEINLLEHGRFVLIALSKLSVFVASGGKDAIP